MALDSFHSLVHLDLKGAPPKLEYLEKVFPLLTKWGATGLLVEYEDMFPYHSELSSLRSQSAYSSNEINTLVRLASQNGLIVIPLVQSFGHLEFVLKHTEYKTLREMADSPMALCPSKPESLKIVCSMIDQVIAAHPGIQWFHIGCDEVYHLGICEQCRKRMTEESLTPHELFFQHVKNVAFHVRNHHQGVIPIIWDDMFRFAEVSILAVSGLGELVVPMVWHYLASFNLPPDLWQKLSSIFSSVWVASAFKGATGPRACATNINYHLENHLNWIAALNEMKCLFKNIHGIAITGWQRYDHYAVLCELLPHGLPSLAMCLQTIRKGLTSEVHETVTADLGFTSLLPLNPFGCGEIPTCSFPGSSVYQLMIEFVYLEAECRKFICNDGCLTWMNDYNVRRNFTNPVHIKPILSTAGVMLAQLEEFQKKLSTALQDIFYPNTVEEWQGTYLAPLMADVQKLVDAGRQQLSLFQGGAVLP
ncbi:hexosaminidase D-like isoform X2 [Pomacea canaliculata]|uniref:hexosaminidase D-like isoform X2 n=1 Tax=Pomacea canaliculata TaxID=400727 RepID=UPI000D73A728|nr:hexosaminidase D-like isoform X2 [Pomacea canaliculata]